VAAALTAFTPWLVLASTLLTENAAYQPPVRLTVCVPAGGYADATITTSGEQRLPDGRVVALHVDGLDVTDAEPCD